MSRPRKRRGKGRVGRCHLQSCPLGTSKKPKAGSRPKAKKRGKSQKCGYRILRLKCAHSTDKKGERAAVGFRYAADAGHELPVFWSVVAGDTAKHADKLRVELDEIIGACEYPNPVGVMAARLGQRTIRGDHNPIS